MKTWLFIKGKMKTSVPVMFLYVLESSGSSPGRQGFCMAVSADGEMCGSIGGGIMEHKFVEMAKARLADGTNVDPIHQQIHDKAAHKNQSGMICSGEQTIFLHRVNAGDMAAIEALLESAATFKNGSLILTENGISFKKETPPVDFHFTKTADLSFQLIEKTGYKNRLYIIGGGHCALALSKLMREMDFYITVYDERDNLNTMSDNVFAHEKIILNSFTELGEIINGGNNVYVVIMTVGYRTDDIAVKALLNTSFRYIGLLGSRKKIEKLFSAYDHAGSDRRALEKICSPVGIQIKSQTPQEIAISIAAQIIAEKNRS